MADAQFSRGKPARLRMDGESVEDYRIAMGWDKPLGLEPGCASSQAKVSEPSETLRQAEAAIAIPLPQDVEPASNLLTRYGVSFSEARRIILDMDAESARGMAISLLIQQNIVDKYAASPAPMSQAPVDSDMVPVGFDDWWATSGFTKYRDTAKAAWEAALTAAPVTSQTVPVAAPGEIPTTRIDALLEEIIGFSPDDELQTVNHNDMHQLVVAAVHRFALASSPAASEPVLAVPNGYKLISGHAYGQDYVSLIELGTPDKIILNAYEQGNPTMFAFLSAFAAPVPAAGEPVAKGEL